MVKNFVIGLLTLALVGIVARHYMHSGKTAAPVAEIKQAEPFKYTISTFEPGLKGYLLYAPTTDDSAQLIIMDLTGKIILQRHVNTLVFDFRQWRIAGKTYYTYASNVTPLKTKGAITTARIVVLDSALKEIKQLHLLAHDDIKLRPNLELDPHDLVMLSEDHFINLVTYEKLVTNIPASLNPAPNKKVHATMIQERVGDKVTWQWDATKFPEFYLNSVEDNNFNDTATTDYTHVNTLTLDPKDSNLILSFKNLNQVIKVSRRTGEIVWRLGGRNSDFPIADDQKFYGQHAVKLINNGQTLQFIDNGEPKKRPYTRILEIQLDEKNKKIASFKQYKVPHSYIPKRGNISTVGENYLICGGVASYILLTNPKTDKYLFEMQLNPSSYRAYIVDSLYGFEKVGARN